MKVVHFFHCILNEPNIINQMYVRFDLLIFYTSIPVSLDCSRNPDVELAVHNSLNGPFNLLFHNTFFHF